jgi:hypothetical protein
VSEETLITLLTLLTLLSLLTLTYVQVFTPAMFNDLKGLMEGVNFPHVDKVA